MLAFGKLLMHNWNTNNSITYASGLTADQVGQWWDDARTTFPNPHFFVNDCSNWDGRVSIQMLRLEYDVYERCGANRSELDVLRQQWHTRARTMHGFSYECNGTRKSGDPNTSCGNSLLNAAAHAYFLEHQNVKYRMIVLGDDITIVSDKMINLTAYADWMTSIGFAIKPKICAEHDADFCSRWFWQMSPHSVLGPKIGRFAARSGWTVSQQHDRGWYGKNLYAFSGVMDLPLLRQLCDRYAIYGEQFTHEDAYRFFPGITYNHTCETREQFQKLYDLEWNQVFFQWVPDLPAVVDYDLLPLLCKE